MGLHASSEITTSENATSSVVLGAGRKRLRARRAPVTGVSTSIVEAIIAAACDLLVARGIESLTTNHVAERAGVSVGSVYRYFPNKLAIVAEIDRRIRCARFERFIAVLDRPGDLASVIHDAFEAFMTRGSPRDERLRNVISREVPPAWNKATSDELWAAAVEHTTRALLQHRPEMSEVVARTKVLVALHAAQGLVDGMTLWHPGEQLAVSAVEEIQRIIAPEL